MSPNDFIMNMIKSKNYEGLFFITVILISIWLFKEFRNNKIELDNCDIKRVNDALIVYSKTIISIKQYQLGKIELSELLIDINLLYPYITKEIAKLVNEFVLNCESDSCKSSGKCKNICRVLQDEILRIKALQHDSVAFKFDGKYLNLISFYYKKNNFSALVIPLVHTFITLICILFMLAYIISFSYTNIISKVVFIIVILSFLFYSFLVMITMDFIYNKTFNKATVDNVKILLFLGSPLIFITGLYWVPIVVFPIGILLYSIYIFKRYKNFKKN